MHIFHSTELTARAINDLLGCPNLSTLPAAILQLKKLNMNPDFAIKILMDPGLRDGRKLY